MYTVKELSRLTGLTPRTLRYYDALGLLSPARNRDNDYRLYGGAEVDRLQEILLYREMGLPLEEIIRQALKKNLGDSTVILISHRVTTLMQAENILVLDKGRIAELGSHEELMKKNGIYRRIYDMQMTLPEEVAAHGA